MGAYYNRFKWENIKEKNKIDHRKDRGNFLRFEHFTIIYQKLMEV